MRGLGFSDAGLQRFHPALLDRALVGGAFENLDAQIADGARCDVVVLEHVLEHVLDVALANPPYQSPGPNRAELEEILA